jgi:hypothetical protein
MTKVEALKTAPRSSLEKVIVTPGKSTGASSFTRILALRRILHR